MFDIKDFMIKPGSKLNLGKVSTDYSGMYNSKDEAEEHIQKNIERISVLQDILYAQDKYALLIVFQGMDAAGKDGAIKHVMSGLNPKGTIVESFKQPSPEELDHDYMWRYVKALPERGNIGIFNRSYYEEVLVVRVHKLINHQQIPREFVGKGVWKKRLQHIGNFEEYLHINGVVILKFFLNISKDEQKNRLMQRLDDPNKNWKFSPDDMREREYWDQYIKCYQEAISSTNSEYAPWYIIPSDKKWFSRLAISEIIVEKLKKMNLKYPSLKQDQLDSLSGYREKLMLD